MKNTDVLGISLMGEKSKLLWTQEVDAGQKRVRDICRDSKTR